MNSRDHGAATPPDGLGAEKRRSARGSRAGDALGKIAILHVAGLLLLATWFFGGGSDRSRLLISCWGSLAAAIALAGFFLRHRGDSEAPRLPAHWLWPLLALNGLVLASCLNPSFTAKILDGESLLAHTGASHPALPSTAHPATSLRHLWLFDALYLSAFNLALVGRRSALRGLLLLAGGNAVLLSIFGTLQKLLSDGLFFGAVPSPNTRFFATFVYGNHWAALAVLMVAVAGGLLFRHVRRHDGSPGAQGRTSLGVTGILLIAITPFIAGSRAGTLMIALLLVMFAGRVLLDVLKRRRERNGSRILPLVGVVVCGAITISGAVWLGREALEERLNDTRSQMQGEMLSGRRELYRDTWQLVRQQPAFGWGLGNYGKVFLLIRPRPLEPNRQYERSYADAHSDWLQALAEVGFTGTILFGLCAAVPLWSLRSTRPRSPVTAYAFLGCTLIVLYALVEFPFGNPAVVLAWWTCFFSAVHYARLPAPARSSVKAPAPAAA
jgi:O-antigen ligase